MRTAARIAAIVLTALLLPASSRAQGVASEGVRLYDARQFGPAKAYFERVLATNTNDLEAVHYMGLLAMQEQRDADAAKWFERAVSIAPNSSVEHMWLGRAYGRQAQRAGALSKLGLAKKAKSAMERAVALDGENLDARADLVQYYSQAPGVAGGSMDKAFEHAAEIRRRDPARGAVVTGSLYERQKKWSDAERTYQQLLRDHPGTPNAELQMGLFFIRSEQYDRAFEHFEAMLRKNPGDLAALFQIGRTGALSGQRLERAAEALTRYIATPRDSGVAFLPADAAAHYRLGNIYEKAGDHARARAEYERVLRLDTQHREAKEALKRVK